MLVFIFLNWQFYHSVFFQILTGQRTGQYQILPLSTELEEERDVAGERAESVEQEVEVEEEEQEEGEEGLLVLGR